MQEGASGSDATSRSWVLFALTFTYSFPLAFFFWVSVSIPASLMLFSFCLEFSSVHTPRASALSH
jgi:hypothetical protein